jgi:hypothetical protein
LGRRDFKAAATARPAAVVLPREAARSVSYQHLVGVDGVAGIILGAVHLLKEVRDAADVERHR